MKKTLLTLTALFASAAVFAQGQSTIQSWDLTPVFQQAGRNLLALLMVAFKQDRHLQ